jgi:hypothetical protein
MISTLQYVRDAYFSKLTTLFKGNRLFNLVPVLTVSCSCPYIYVIDTYFSKLTTLFKGSRLLFPSWLSLAPVPTSMLDILISINWQHCSKAVGYSSCPDCLLLLPLHLCQRYLFQSSDTIFQRQSTIYATEYIFYCKRAILFLSSSKILTPHPPLRLASVYPPPLLRGEDRLAGRRMGWGVNILEDERNRIALVQ